ncbi:MAG: hypothetical protein F4077_07520 [Gammaproteobacteria bacterium]|nr:hypothetical protein [Gammaproteobacteria bacterium]MYI77593.1 hypothetical protein [Gammaproteobacteria bacterium]
MSLINRIFNKAGVDKKFRSRLLENPKAAINQEFGLQIAEDQEIVVHEETDTTTHLVLPPKDKLSVAERAEAKTGATSLEFLKKTMYDPAPPKRATTDRTERVCSVPDDVDSFARAGRESIVRGLQFLRSTVNENGAWHCIRFNVGDPNIPRHFERPPFISAFCVLALQRSKEPLAQELCAKTKKYIVKTMEYPGFWRYYRHLPLDLDSSSLCSMVINSHPWIGLGRNLPRMLANRDNNGLFLTWVLSEEEPSVVAPFRIEADPVVNANVIAYVGDVPATKKAQQWLKEMIEKGTNLEDASKWYPDPASIYYAIARTTLRVQLGSEEFPSLLAERILSLRDETSEFKNVLQAAQAVVALHNVGQLNQLNVQQQIANFIDSQQEDGSWPELLAFGDQSLRFGVVGQIGHGSESVTSAFCVEALECLMETLKN